MGTASRFLFRLVLAVLIASPAFAADPSPLPNYQGLWWNSPPESESGWGVNLAHQGDVIFATWFTYDAAGHGRWLAMTANRTAAGTYGGTLIETAGPAFDTMPFDPTKVTRAAVGSGTLTFPDADNGTFRYTLKGVEQTKYITRHAFGPIPTCTYEAKPDFAAATNYQDIWWVAEGAESGWGVNLTHQGDTIFATWFTYDSEGAPLWLAVTAPRVDQSRAYSGQLIRTSGPAFSAVPFDPKRVTRAVAGTATFTFANGNAGTFAYTLNGASQTKAITRYLFAPPAGTRCGAPYRTQASFSVVAAGDIAQCDNVSAAASAAATTAALVNPGDAFVLTLGDNAYQSGTAAEFANCFHPTWGAFKDRIHPAPGNHEYYTPNAEGYFDYFGAQAGPDRRGYYSFDHGGWHFISLNSSAYLTPDSEQYRWLMSDLEKSKDSLCTIAVLHFPAFNSGATHGGEASAQEMKPVFAALQAAGVDMLLSGHEHVYERFAPQKADGTADPERGLRQFVVGTGGGKLGTFKTPMANSEFRYNANFGVLRLTLGQGSYGWQFMPVGGRAPVDTGTATCHR